MVTASNQGPPEVFRFFPSMKFPHSPAWRQGLSKHKERRWLPCWHELSLNGLCLIASGWSSFIATFSGPVAVKKKKSIELFPFHFLCGHSHAGTDDEEPLPKLVPFPAPAAGAVLGLSGGRLSKHELDALVARFCRTHFCLSRRALLKSQGADTAAEPRTQPLSPLWNPLVPQPLWSLCLLGHVLLETLDVCCLDLPFHLPWTPCSFLPQK